MDDPVPTYTIIHADGLYPDDKVEQEILRSSKQPPDYRINYIQVNLWTLKDADARPWSSIDKCLRDQVDGITLQKLAFTAADLELFPRLKVIVRMGVGYDRLDRNALSLRTVTVCNIPDYGTCEVADHAFALFLSLRRGITLYHDTQRSTLGAPAKWARIESPLIARIQNSTFGVLGLGRIGIAVAQRAKAFGCRVLFYDPHVPVGIDRSLDIERTDDIHELFRRSAVVSCHCPLTRQTRKIVNHELLRQMPRGSILVNTARGEVVDLDAVEQCLRDGTLSGVGLDVLSREPIPDDDAEVHPLIRAYRQGQEEWLLGKMVLSPHSAWHSPESLRDIRVKSAETMRDVLIRGVQKNIILPEQE